MRKIFQSHVFMGPSLPSSRTLGSYRFNQVFWVDFWISDMRKTLRGQFFIGDALEFWNFRRFHQVFSIFYGTITLPRWFKVSSEILGSTTETMGFSEFPSGFSHFLMELQPCRGRNSKI